LKKEKRLKKEKKALKKEKTGRETIYFLGRLNGDLWAWALEKSGCFTRSCYKAMIHFPTN
jgi:hypothetical protein